MSIQLTGIDARNPCGYLAALGALRLLVDSGRHGSTLSWRRVSPGRYVPLVDGNDLGSPEQLADAIMKAHLGRDLAAELGWDKDVMALQHGDVVAQLDRTRADRRAREVVGACASELPLRGPEQRAPYTPLRMIPRVGRARFLATGHALSNKLTEKQVVNAIFGPWRYVKANNMRWDPGATVPARAYTAEAPTKFGPLGVPGAVVLAMAALVHFPLITTIHAARCRGQRPGPGRSRTFTFPVWDSPLTEQATRTALGSPLVHEPADKLDWPRLRRHHVAAIVSFRREGLSSDSDMLGWGELLEATDG